MNSDNDKEQCCNDNQCSSNKEPRFKKTLMITNITPLIQTACKDDCCSDDPAKENMLPEIKITKNMRTYLVEGMDWTCSVVLLDVNGDRYMRSIR